MSIGTLCDNGCKATFDDIEVIIENKKNKEIVMRGDRDPVTKLYSINISQENKLMTELETPDENFAGNIYECKSKRDLVNYHHASCWSPTTSGWIKSIKNNFFTTWPGLNANTVAKYLSKKEATVLGHLKQTHKGIRSTKQKVLPALPEIDTEQFPPTANSIKTNDVYFKVIELEGKILTDQTGRFPVTSSRGHKYIMVAYHYNSNTIHTEPLKTRKVPN